MLLTMIVAKMMIVEVVVVDGIDNDCGGYDDDSNEYDCVGYGALAMIVVVMAMMLSKIDFVDNDG